MKLVNLLRDSLRLYTIILAFIGLGLLMYWPVVQTDDVNTIIMLSMGILSTGILGSYIIFGAIFGVWTKRFTITRPQILRYFFKTGEKINIDHRYKQEEIIDWCNENTHGFIHVMPTDIEKVFTDSHFFFKKRKDRLFFKMVWG